MSLNKFEAILSSHRKAFFVYVRCILFFSLFFLISCASEMQKNSLDKFNSLYNTGQYTEAANLELLEKGEKKSDPSNLLQSLQAAASLRCAKQYEKSSELFDECEEIIKYHNEQLLAVNVASKVGATLLNDAILDFKGHEYDGIMVNTYKALNFWQLGERDKARVEFNRALDRQRRARERFAAEIAKQKEELKEKQDEEKKKKSTLDFSKNLSNPEIEKILKNKYSNLYEYSAYPDFVNPFTTYIAGLFFMSEGDYTKASDLLKEAYGMVSECPAVSNDFAIVENILDGSPDKKNYTWVIFENGLGPVKEEFRIDLPLMLVTDVVHYTGIALPKLKFRNKACEYLSLSNSSGVAFKTDLLSSMDRVVETEFNKRYPFVLARAVVSALIKTYGQYLAQSEYGTLGGLAGAIFQAATTSADIRIWTALPKEFQIAKIETPKDGIFFLETPSGNKTRVEVPKNENSLLYVKIPVLEADAVFDVIKM